MRIGAIVVILQSSCENLVNRCVDVVFFLIASTDTETSFREVSAAAQGCFFFKNDRFGALVNCTLSSC